MVADSVNRSCISALMPTPDGLAAFEIKLDRIIGKELAAIIEAALQGGHEELVPQSSDMLAKYLEIYEHMVPAFVGPELEV